MADGRVPNDELVAAGVELMRRAQKPLTRKTVKGRAMIYETESGETVRVRTCNDHLLVVLADSPAADAKLNIEGTDYVLVVMPEKPRTPGSVVAYLVPASVAASAARETHKNWLATNPNTKGDNRTWNLWFDENGPEKANGFATKWSQYRLAGKVVAGGGLLVEPKQDGSKLGDIIAAARREIASAAGVPISSVKISVDLS